MLNVNLGVNFMNLHTPFSLECCPLVDFANDIKEKRKKEGTISSNLFILRHNILSDSFSASRNLSEKYFYIPLPRSFGGVQLHTYQLRIAL